MRPSSPTSADTTSQLGPLRACRVEEMDWTVDGSRFGCGIGISLMFEPMTSSYRCAAADARLAISASNVPKRSTLSTLSALLQVLGTSHITDLTTMQERSALVQFDNLRASNPVHGV